MANPRGARPGQPSLRRDNQQWVFDYVIQQSGRVYHWWTGDGRTLPDSVRSHAMVSKHLGRRGLAKEADAQARRADGDERGALELLWDATRDLIKAQHHIFELNDEKRFLYDSMRRCYDQVVDLCPYPVERIEIPFDGEVVAGNLHLCPGVGRAPLLFYMPGCDTTCESSPDPTDNLVHKRGMHVFSFDGPGLGQSNMRGIRLAGDNFERAASAALDVLVQRPEIDPSKIVTYGGGMGSYWAMRLIATDHRLKAAATKSSYCDKYFIMNEDSPRYKRLFGFLTGATTEAELDAAMAEMTLEDHMARIECPTLMLTGEYDHRDPDRGGVPAVRQDHRAQGAVGVRRPVPPAPLRRRDRGLRRPARLAPRPAAGRGDDTQRRGGLSGARLRGSRRGYGAPQASLVRGGLKPAYTDIAIGFAVDRRNGRGGATSDGVVEPVRRGLTEPLETA